MQSRRESVNNAQQRELPVQLIELAFTSDIISDSTMSFLTMFKPLSNLLLFHIWDIRIIRSHMPQTVVLSLANVLAFSQLDYCNSLLTGTTKRFLHKL